MSRWPTQRHDNQHQDEADPAPVVSSTSDATMREAKDARVPHRPAAQPLRRMRAFSTNSRPALRAADPSPGAARRTTSPQYHARDMKQPARIVAVVVIALLALGVIGYGWARSAKPAGVTGGIVSDLQSDTLLAGSVQVRRHGRVIAGQQVQPGQTFRLTVKPGTYDLVVGSPGASCPPSSIFIPEGQFLGLRIACMPT